MEQDEDLIVLTDRDVPARDDVCPKCGGKGTQIEASPFGMTTEIICGVCGHSFGMKERKR